MASNYHSALGKYQNLMIDLITVGFKIVPIEKIDLDLLNGKNEGIWKIMEYDRHSGTALLEYCNDLATMDMLFWLVHTVYAEYLSYFEWKIVNISEYVFQNIKHLYCSVQRHA